MNKLWMFTANLQGVDLTKENCPSVWLCNAPTMDDAIKGLRMQDFFEYSDMNYPQRWTNPTEVLCYE
jgi:hypothetical protein